MFTTINAGELINGDVVVTAERDALMFDRVIANTVKGDRMLIGTDAVSVMRNGSKVRDGVVRTSFATDDLVCVVRNPSVALIASANADKPKRKRPTGKVKVN